MEHVVIDCQALSEVPLFDPEGSPLVDEHGQPLTQTVRAVPQVLMMTPEEEAAHVQTQAEAQVVAEAQAAAQAERVAQRDAARAVIAERAAQDPAFAALATLLGVAP